MADLYRIFVGMKPNKHIKNEKMRILNEEQKRVFSCSKPFHNNIVDSIANSAEAPSEQETSKKILVPVLRIRIRDPVPF